MRSDSTADFVARDHELESAHGKATEALAAHRYRWTLDESNPERLSIAEYARRISRGRASVHRMAYGYEAFVRNSGHSALGGPVTLTDFIEQANLSAEKAEAVAAIAATTGKSFSNTAVSQRTEVREVLDTARERAERKGTTVSEEIPAVAEFREKAKRARQSARDDRAAKRVMLVEFEGHIGAAMRRLREALAIARDVDFDAEETEVLEDTLDKLKTLVQLIDVRITGESSIDWDDEFAKAMES